MNLLMEFLNRTKSCDKIGRKIKTELGLEKSQNHKDKIFGPDFSNFQIFQILRTRKLEII